MTNRRILVTAQSGALGGVERRMVQEVEVLHRMGMAVLAAPSRFPSKSQFGQSLASAGAKLIEWQPYKFIERQQPSFPFPQLCGWARREIQRVKLDLAHVAMTWTTVGLSRVWALAEAGVPVVLGLHCTYDRARLPAELQPHVRRALRGVVGGYAVSSSARQSFLQNYGDWIDADKISVIHNGIDVKRFKPDPQKTSLWRSRHSIPLDAKVLAFCGRLDHFKNPSFALDVFEAAAAQRPGLHLLIAGEGPLGDALRRRVAASQLLRARVHMIGYVHDVENALQASDAYLSTSCADEGFPLAPSEALACGLPIFVPAHPAFVEAFGACPAARLLNGLDPDAWADAILATLAENGHQRNLGKIAREFAVARLAQDGMQKQLTEFYQRWL